MKILRWILVFGFFTGLVLVFTYWFTKIGEFNTIKSFWCGRMKIEHKFYKDRLYFVKNKTAKKYLGFKYLGTINDSAAICYSKDSLIIPNEILKNYRGIKYEVSGLFYDKEVVYPNLINELHQKFSNDSLFYQNITLIKKADFFNWPNLYSIIVTGEKQPFLKAFSWLPWYDRISMNLVLNPPFIVFFIIILGPLIIFLEWLKHLVKHKYLWHLLNILLLFMGLKNTVGNPIIYEFNFFFTNCFFLISILTTYLLFQCFILKINEYHFLEREVLKFLFIITVSISMLIIFLNIFDILYYEILKINKYEGPSPIWWYATHVEARFILIFATSILFANLLRQYYFNNKDSIKSKILLLQAEKDKMELASLQARVNPHFLYNSLNSIASLATLDAPKTERMATLLADFYKYNTNRNTKFTSELGEEIKVLDTYIEIEKVRFGEKLIFEKKVEESALQFEIPSNLIQPLIENAIKYGFNAISKNINIILEIKHDETGLSLNVYDSGRPFNQQLNSGFGLQSVIRKLELTYGERQSLQLINEPTKHISIKINSKKK
ncbi:MAG: hypothetical protein RLZZ546_1733 [Bacteroidota bacterium]|jgi:sensor histidine kinase YesM